MREWLKGLALMSLGFIIGIAALEYGLSKFAPHRETWTNGKVYKGFHEPDKYIGWKGIPGKEKKFVIGRIDSYVKMNSHGFRDRERNYEKGQDVFRIIVLGDSMTEALQVPLEETFQYILEERLNSESSSGSPASFPLDRYPRSQRFEVINLGVTAFGTAQEYLTLKHYGLKYQPDFVILALLYGNDVLENSPTLLQDPRLPAPDPRPYFVLNNDKLEEIPFKIPSEEGGQTKRVVTGRFKILKELLEKFIPNVYYSLKDAINKTPVLILKEFLSKLFPSAYYPLSDRVHETPWLANFLRNLGIMAPEAPGLTESKKNEIYIRNFEIYAVEYPPEWQNAWEVTKGLILKLGRELEMNKIGFLVVIIPAEFEIQPYEWGKFWEKPYMKALIDLKKPERILSNFLEANNIDYFSLGPGFRKYTKETGKRLHFPYKYEKHWNATGHALVAELIYKELKGE